VPYDHLVLCTGVQYQVPKPTGLDVNAGATNSDIEVEDADEPEPQPRLLDPVPKNVFVVNDAYEAAVFLYWLETNVLQAKSVCLELYLLMSWFQACFYQHGAPDACRPTGAGQSQMMTLRTSDHDERQTVNSV